MKIREDANRKRTRRQELSTARVANHREKARVEVYQRNFRGWHMQLLLIIILLLACMYLIILHSPWMFNLVNALKVDVIA